MATDLAYKERARCQCLSWAMGNSHHNKIDDECAPDFLVVILLCTSKMKLSVGLLIINNMEGRIKMRINVYTEELITTGNNPVAAEIVTAGYVSSRTGQPMTNYGIRIYLKSHPDLHYVPPRDDDRSAVTFWCGPSLKNAVDYWKFIGQMAFNWNESGQPTLGPKFYND